MTWREFLKDYMKKHGDELKEFEAISYMWPKNKDGSGELVPRFTKIMSKADLILAADVSELHELVLWTKTNVYFSWRGCINHVPRNPRKIV